VIEKSGGPYRGRFQWVKTSSKPGVFLENVEIPALLKLHRATLFHDTGATGLWTGGIPTVVTVHEMLTPQKQRLKRVLRNSNMVIAVSEHLAREIEEGFHLSRPKIRVIGNAIDPWYHEIVSANEIRVMKDRFKILGKYFLCVSADRPSKNLHFVRQLAGNWEGAEQWIFTTPQPKLDSLPPRSLYLDIVEDVWLRSLYAACSALVVPSLYEGFSLPPVEVLSAGGVPVVSDIPVHKEVLGDILPRELFFDPKDEKDLKRALNAVLNGGEPLKLSVLEKFRAMRERYSFAETAEKVHSVYREIL
jgi:glycosyltransferase involved in cell wall biosynthesis